MQQVRCYNKYFIALCKLELQQNVMLLTVNMTQILKKRHNGNLMSF